MELPCLEKVKTGCWTATAGRTVCTDYVASSWLLFATWCKTSSIFGLLQKSCSDVLTKQKITWREQSQEQIYLFSRVFFPPQLLRRHAEACHSSNSFLHNTAHWQSSASFSATVQASSIHWAASILYQKHRSVLDAATQVGLGSMTYLSPENHVVSLWHPRAWAKRGTTTPGWSSSLCSNPIGERKHRQTKPSGS